MIRRGVGVITQETSKTKTQRNCTDEWKLEVVGRTGELFHSKCKQTLQESTDAAKAKRRSIRRGLGKLRRTLDRTKNESNELQSFPNF